MRFPGQAAAVALSALVVGALLAMTPATGPALTAPASASTLRGDPAGDTVTGASRGDIRRVLISMPSSARLRFVVHLAEGSGDSVFVNLVAGRRMYQVRGDSLYRVRTFDIEGGRAHRVSFVARAERGGRAVVVVPTAPFDGARRVGWMVETLEGTSPVDRVPDEGMARYIFEKVPIQARGLASVRPGRPTAIRIDGFPAGAKVGVLLQPTPNRGGNGFGYAVRRSFRVGASGAALLRFAFPRGYYGCSPGLDCTVYRWRPGGRVDMNVCTEGRGVPVCARHVARIAG